MIEPTRQVTIAIAYFTGMISGVALFAVWKDFLIEYFEDKLFKNKEK